MSKVFTGLHPSYLYGSWLEHPEETATTQEAPFLGILRQIGVAASLGIGGEGWCFPLAKLLGNIHDTHSIHLISPSG